LQKDPKMKLSLRSVFVISLFVLIGLFASFFVASRIVQDGQLGLAISAVNFVTVAIIVAFIYLFVIRKLLNEISAAHEKKTNSLVVERSQLLINTTPMTVILYDTNHQPVGCNDNAVKMFGFSKKSDFLDGFFSFAPEIQPDGTTSVEIVKYHLTKAFTDGYSYTDEYICTRADGTPFIVESTFMRIPHNEGFAVLEYTRDISEEKRAEQEKRELELKLHEQELHEKAVEELRRVEIAEASNRAKSDFLARMSHEIRTPISSVLGISEIELRKSGLPLNMKESFVKINSSANMLLGIVNDILDLSKIEAGKMKLISKEYDVASTINDIARLNMDYLDTKNLDFRLIVDPNLPSHLIGDVLRVEQILNNLLSNAFKYTEHGFVELSWQSRPHETKDDHIMLEITVTDTGFGMTKSQLYILQSSEYTRFHEHENRNIDGTGLGLSIVYNLLRLMDGHVKIESEVGKGTKIAIHIPQKRCANENAIGKETAESLQNFEKFSLFSTETFSFEPESMPYGSVLIVDDVDANLYVAEGLMSFYDLKIETSSSGYEAIERVKRGENFDIIFMDHMMPGLNGMETMKILRDKGYDAPIVALTANAIIGQAEEFVKSGFDDFISKPIQTKHLNATLQKFIKDRHTPDEIAAARSAPKNPTQDMNALAEKLRHDFVKNHANGFEKIKNAIDAGDIDDAILAAHTLKGVAGLICEQALARSVGRVEQVLSRKETPSTKLMDTIQNEMMRVLGEIGEISVMLEDDADGAPPDNNAALMLLQELEPLLASQDTECMNFNLHKIPNAEKLREQIENFDFADALETLQILKAEIERGIK